MAWVQEGEEWQREDGVRIRYDPYQRAHWWVVSKHGSILMQVNSDRPSNILRFKTAKGAMDTTDRRWPVKVQESA